MKEKILVSACLAGIKCRYNGSDAHTSELIKELSSSELIICCPELLGGMPIPRPACNIHGGEGQDVVDGNAEVIGIDNKNYTENYRQGALKALKIALSSGVTKAYLKKNSPSCGCGEIYQENGKALKSGDGILTALLKNEGIKVIAI